MTRLLNRSGMKAGAEIDNVLEHDAGLRSLADACRLLKLDAPAVLSLIARDELPNAFQAEGQWRIPREDIRHRLAIAGARGPGPSGFLVRRREPFRPSETHPPMWLTPAERRVLIIERLTRDHFVRVTTLSAEFGVSQMTIRRDLSRLESEGRLVRTHGGAMTAGRSALTLALRPAR